METALHDLPVHLAERTRPLTTAPPRAAGGCVLYWMRTACRGHENPALDVALEMAARLEVPVLVYQEVGERDPYASDRHHTFNLEGARDVAAELEARGIGHVLHLERPGQRGPHLLTLAGLAALVVTEEMPVEPLRGRTEGLAASTPAPVWAVDTACIVPMRLTKKTHDRAFAFRKATEALRHERLDEVWVDAAVPHPRFVPDDLPFEPVDLARASIPDLVAACEIDHAIAPVPHTRGGTAAGYARWAAFRERRLKAYARKRNDALATDAVSRMSSYLHYGQVSPFRIAREASAVGGDGAAKFLDELLVWRELGHAWCFHRRDHDQLSALPGWARETLDAHAGDPRPALLSWETLARARTGDPLWDAAERSLLIHGELHNNVRMTWGKALLGWTPSPARAVELLIDLNHRYALDGRDPNSYSGLLWCLGGFDRPFTPEKPVQGAVRPRPTSAHARRLDVDAYARLTGRPAHPQPPRVAVIGAGIAGLTSARTLADHAMAVTVFDKARGTGGRLATRRTAGFQFDHGAQHFTARSEPFRRHVASWVEDGLVAPWRGRFATIEDGHLGPVEELAERFVGAPSMSRVGRHLAADLDVHTGTRIERLARSGGGWRLLDGDGVEHGHFDVVVIAVPAPQALPLLEGAPALAAAARDAHLEPCWAVMAAFERPLDLAFDAARVAGGPLAWIAHDASKPGRTAAETWVLHASPAWSAANLEEDGEAVGAALVDAFSEITGGRAHPTLVQAHRWRYALASRPVGAPCRFDPAAGLGVCGDWLLGGRIEAAFTSGAALAGRVLGTPVA